MSDIPGWAVRGAKVMCIEKDNWGVSRPFIVDEAGQLTFPQNGEVYTIREVRVRFVTEHMQLMVGVLLDEVVNPVASFGSATGEEMCFDINGFRPLVARKDALGLVLMDEAGANG